MAVQMLLSSRCRLFASACARRRENRLFANMHGRTRPRGRRGGDKGLGVGSDKTLGDACRKEEHRDEA